MSTREEAQEFLNKLNDCVPISFYSELETARRGVGFILRYLEQSDGEVVAGDFSKQLNVSTARIAALLKKMEQGGLITRRRSSKDARQTVVELTPAGRAYVNEMNEQALMKIEAVLNYIGKEEMENFIQISHKIREAMDR